MERTTWSSSMICSLAHLFQRVALLLSVQDQYGEDKYGEFRAKGLGCKVQGLGGHDLRESSLAYQRKRFGFMREVL